MKKIFWIAPCILGCFALALVVSNWGSFGRLSDFNVGVAGDGELNSALERIRSGHDLPALAAMLIIRGEVAETGAVGVRAAGSPELVTTNDRWHLGSITKSMTATLAAVLVEEGAISWNTTIGEVFPDLAESSRPEYADVRLEELLSHTAGLPKDQTLVPSFAAFRKNAGPLPEQRRLWTAEILALAPARPRGEHLYGNTNYIVAGAMLEVVTGEPWEDLMQRAVLTPLDMNSTGFGPPGSVGTIPDEPRGHSKLNGEWVAHQPDLSADNPPAIGPAGTVHSTLSDFARYMAAHLSGARGENGLVTSESFRKLHSPAPGTAYSLGFAVVERSWAGGQALQHTGSNQIWFASMWISPKRDFALLAVTNAAGDDGREGTDEAIRALIDRFNAAPE